MRSRDDTLWNELTRLFPIVCHINESGSIVNASSVLRDRCHLSSGESVNFFELFRFKRPAGFDYQFESALRYQGTLFLGFNTTLGFAIRGQFMDFTRAGLNGLCFVGVPWLWWIESNAPQTRLTFADFPVHDVQMDQLFFMSTQQNMVEDLQQTNEQLKAAKEKLEQASLSRQNYFNHVSHEMRTPLNGVISALTLLADASYDDRSKELVRLASHSASRLLEVINFTLESASVDSGLSSAEDRVFDLDALLDECLAISQPKALEKGLELHRTGQQVFSTPYRGRARLLRQVLGNLVSNAVKFSDAGVVALGARVKKTPDDSFDLIRFTVADEGPGIPDSAMERLFEPFATGLSKETEVQQGTGLGLSIVKRFVEVLGGNVEVESAEGEGAVFSFDVPLEKASLHELSTPSQTEVNFHEYAIRGHILLVDDMQTNLLLNAKVLESIGVETTTVTSGEAAVELFSANPEGFDLLFLDLEMPGMDGCETAQQIRALESGKKVPIIALSAHVGDSDRRRAIAAGMNNFMAKPLVREEVVSELQDWLDIERVQGNEPASDTHDSGAEVGQMEELDMTEPEQDEEFSAEKLQGLLGDVGVNVTKTLVQKFLTESADRWERLRSAIDAADTPIIAREAHTLGSSCFTFGITAAGRRFRRIEADAEAQRPVTVEQLQSIQGPLAAGIQQMETMLNGVG